MTGSSKETRLVCCIACSHVRASVEREEAASGRELMATLSSGRRESQALTVDLTCLPMICLTWPMTACEFPNWPYGALVCMEMSRSSQYSSTPLDRRTRLRSPTKVDGLLKMAISCLMALAIGGKTFRWREIRRRSLSAGPQKQRCSFCRGMWEGQTCSCNAK